MQIIPVIDLKNGIVVHAYQGNRDDYAPLKSLICKSSDIFDVVDVFWTLFRFSTIYIADLNAITRQGNNSGLLNNVLSAFPQITFWIDGGYPLSNDDFLQLSNFLPVLGSESFQDENVSAISKFNGNFTLSLDYSLAGELGAKTLFSNQDLWPKRIIIMSLPKVGSNLGPDLDRLTAYRNQYPQQKFIAAGGIRDNQDLKELDQIGIKHVLVATALHNGKINPDEIAQQTGKKIPRTRGIFNILL
jgi:phosphoribosylformimino-5-aminoimidazole carboxamide ribotide isomerase